MGMGTWVAIAICLFVLGSIMALKPNVIDVRLDKLRMSARRLELHPKVIVCPDWIRGSSGDLGAGMIAQYSIILDDKKLPETHYQVTDGTLVLVKMANNSAENAKNIFSNTNHTSTHSDSLDSSHSLTQTLNNEIESLPHPIKPFVKGVYSKANCIVIFWHDSSYVKPNTNPSFDINDIEQDLKALKSCMMNFSNKLASKPSKPIKPCKQ